MLRPWMFLWVCLLPGVAAAEDVVEGTDGSQLRGKLIGDVAACRNKAPGALCEVRIAGGSILVMPTEEVDKVRKGRKLQDHTGHGGQVGLRIAGGGSVGLWVDEQGVEVPIDIPLAGSLTWGITDAMELQVGYRGTPLSANSALSSATVGFRYYLVPLDRFKFYQSAELLLGGLIGLRTTSGYQLDLFRALGFYIETGFAGGLITETGGFTISWEGVAGLHLRI